MTNRLAVYFGALAVLLVGIAIGLPANAMMFSRVFVNGQAVRVEFNDGDTFKVLQGRMAPRNARLAGFNTLESFGPVHYWGDWHPYELYVIAKQATLNARRGVWHCAGDVEHLDGYGRLLFDCPDLAVDQIRKGYAHALNVGDTPARPEYLRAQAEAQSARRGMWAKGVPEFIITSTHSYDEDPSREFAGNRLVSTRDGHSEFMQHQIVVSDCTWICNDDQRVPQTVLAETARRLRSNNALAPVLRNFFNVHLEEFALRYARTAHVPEYVPEADRGALEGALSELKANGTLTETVEQRGSCMLHVHFTRRYDRLRAECLKGHGTTP